MNPPGGVADCQPLPYGQVSVQFSGQREGVLKSVGSERRGLMGKARSLRGHRAPVGRGDHLKREGGVGWWELTESEFKGDCLLHGIASGRPELMGS